jgi:soluble lytic murein transglycosylase-like protein
MRLVLPCLKKYAVGALLSMLGGLFALPAFADVYGYVDAKGVAHFSTQKLDERYELFYKIRESFSTENSNKFAPGTGEVRGGSYQIPTGTGRAPTKLLAYFDISPNYKSVKHLLKDASQTHGIDYELLQALIATESGFDRFAVSPKGAVGLMQVMPQTAARYGVRSDKKTPIEKKLTDPKTNIRAGASYLRDLIDLFPGQLELAVAAYNAGEGAVQRSGNKIPNYPETQNYVKTVMQLYGHLKPPAAMLDAGRRYGRVRMEMMGGNANGVVGSSSGTTGRGNMPPMLVDLPQQSAAPPEANKK